MIAGSTERPDPLPGRTAVAIIGAGIAGIATAYYLAKAGIPVVVLEKGRIAGEQSSRNWGWVRKQGRDPRELPAIIESLKLWPGLKKELGADIGWRRSGVTYVAQTDEQLARFETWLELARPFQLDTRLLSPAETARLLGQDDGPWKGALHTASDGRAEPAQVVPAMARAAGRLGAKIVERCAVRTIETRAGKVSGVITEHGRIDCSTVVCAGGAWSALFTGNLGIGLPQLRVCSSVMRTRPAPLATDSAVWCGDVAFRRRHDGGYTLAASAGSRFDIVPDALRYFGLFAPARRLNRGEVRLRFGAAFFRALATPKRWKPDAVTPFERTRVLDPAPDRALLARALRDARALLPQFAQLEMAESWAGMIDVMPDTLPVVSAIDGLDGFYLATGFSGHGFGMGPATGLLMAELITKGAARVDLAPFRFSRFLDGTPMEPFKSAL